VRVASWRKNTVLQVLVSATFALPYSLCHHASKPVRVGVSVGDLNEYYYDLLSDCT
ncbi:hypothetical protein C0J52_22025, partial [Blattella germanica]